MAWMGHLPALATPQLRNALVICFGTGQTAHAVRQHRPERLYVVDISRAVFDAAPFFYSNHGVLDDPVVHAVVMDGRAFLRRATDLRFDLVTLEPMPPNFAGVNNLYSHEFYTLVHSRLTETGVAAQWLPVHLLAPSHMKSIVASFASVFPHTRVWIEPELGTGILVGATRPWTLRPSGVPLPLAARDIESQFLLDSEAVAALAADGERVTDDNQLLSYGPGRFARGGGPRWWERLSESNRAILQTYAGVEVDADD